MRLPVAFVACAFWGASAYGGIGHMAECRIGDRLAQMLSQIRYAPFGNLSAPNQPGGVNITVRRNYPAMFSARSRVQAALSSDGNANGVVDISCPFAGSWIEGVVKTFFPDPFSPLEKPLGECDMAYRYGKHNPIRLIMPGSVNDRPDIANCPYEMVDTNRRRALDRVALGLPYLEWSEVSTTSSLFNASAQREDFNRRPSVIDNV